MLKNEFEILKRCGTCGRVKINGTYVDLNSLDDDLEIELGDWLLKPSFLLECINEKIIPVSHGPCSPECIVKGYGLSYEEAIEIYKEL